VTLSEESFEVALAKADVFGKAFHLSKVIRDDPDTTHQKRAFEKAFGLADYAGALIDLYAFAVEEYQEMQVFEKVLGLATNILDLENICYMLTRDGDTLKERQRLSRVFQKADEF
jgi:hypothetical protein